MLTVIYMHLKIYQDCRWACLLAVDTHQIQEFVEAQQCTLPHDKGGGHRLGVGGCKCTYFNFWSVGL